MARNGFANGRKVYTYFQLSCVVAVFAVANNTMCFGLIAENQESKYMEVIRNAFLDFRDIVDAAKIDNLEKSAIALLISSNFIYDREVLEEFRSSLQIDVNRYISHIEIDMASELKQALLDRYLLLLNSNLIIFESCFLVSDHLGPPTNVDEYYLIVKQISDTIYHTIPQEMRDSILSDALETWKDTAHSKFTFSGKQFLNQEELNKVNTRLESIVQLLLKNGSVEIGKDTVLDKSEFVRFRAAAEAEFSRSSFPEGLQNRIDQDTVEQMKVLNRKINAVEEVIQTLQDKRQEENEQRLRRLLQEYERLERLNALNLEFGFDVLKHQLDFFPLCDVGVVSMINIAECYSIDTVLLEGGKYYRERFSFVLALAFIMTLSLLMIKKRTR